MRSPPHIIIRASSFKNYAALGEPLAAPGMRGVFIFHPHRDRRKLPRTRASIWVVAKQCKASCGEQTIGSFSLNDVLRRSGMPVRRRNASIKFQNFGFAILETDCTRPGLVDMFGCRNFGPMFGTYLENHQHERRLERILEILVQILFLH